jgi:hypothetical protein
MGFPPTHGQWAQELQDRGPAEVGALGGLGRARKARAKPKQQNEAKLKQMPKTTNEEENKSQQTLGQKKQ